MAGVKRKRMRASEEKNDIDLSQKTKKTIKTNRWKKKIDKQQRAVEETPKAKYSFPFLGGCILPCSGYVRCLLTFLALFASSLGFGN
jgi:hypothetical protein